VIGRLIARLSDDLRHRARRRIWPADMASGRRGEDLAHRFLQGRGLRVVARNYRARSGAGEIDLVAWDGDTLAFVEVKSRRTEEFGTPDRAVDRDKRQALVRAGREYARRARIDWKRVRFDVVSVVFSDPPALSHVRNAFSPEQAL
jgi:putative endonuclease